MENYYLVLSGKPLEGYRDREVIPALAHLLHMSEEQARGLLQGRPARIRKGLMKEKATRMMSKIIACGAGCDIEQVERYRSEDPKVSPAGDAVHPAPGPAPLPAEVGQDQEQTNGQPAFDELPDLALDTSSVPAASALSLEPVEEAPAAQASEQESRTRAPEHSSTAAAAPPPTTLDLELSLEPVVEESSEQGEVPGDLALESIEIEDPTAKDKAGESGAPEEPIDDAPHPGRMDHRQRVADFSSSNTGDGGGDPGTVYDQPVRSQARVETSEPAISQAGARSRWLLVVPATLLVLAAAWGGMQLIGGSGPDASGVDDMAMSQIKRPPVDPRQAATQSRLDALASSVRIWMIQYGSGFDPAQVTMDRMQQDLGISAQDMLDGWGTPIHYRVEGDRFQLVSAGADRVFDSGDDRLLERSAR